MTGIVPRGRIVIAGGTGFLGSAIVGQLLADRPVAVLSRGGGAVAMGVGLAVTVAVQSTLTRRKQPGMPTDASDRGNRNGPWRVFEKPIRNVAAGAVGGKPDRHSVKLSPIHGRSHGAGSSCGTPAVPAQPAPNRANVPRSRLV